jgi:hypothetical protein
MHTNQRTQRSRECHARALPRIAAEEYAITNDRKTNYQSSSEVTDPLTGGADGEDM